MSIQLSKLSLLATAVILFSFASSAHAGNCGDVNDDGSGPDLSDLTHFVSYLFLGGPQPAQMYAANVNGDSQGLVDLSDLIYLVNYLFLGGSTPICPISTPYTTTIIPPESSDIIQGYDTAAGVITLSQSSYYAQMIAVDDIIIGQDDVIAPHGFLRKVTSIATQGGSIVMETGPATMMEAFEEMDIDETHRLNPADVKSLRLYNGTTFQPNRDGQTFDVSLNCVLYDQDGDFGTTDDQIRLDGMYAFTADLFAKIKIRSFSLKKFEVGIETDEQVDLDLIAKFQWEFNETAEFDLAEFHLGAIPIGGAVWLVPSLTVEAHIHGDLTVTFETGITYTQELRYGFGWEEDAWYTINESTKEFACTPPQFSAEFSFETGVSLNASCMLYGVAGPYVGAEAGFHFLAALNADPCDVELTFDLEAMLYAVAGIECDLLNLDYNHSWQLYTHFIGQWVYPLSGSSTIAIDVEPDSIDAPWSLSGPCSYSVGGIGDETLVDLNPGDYTVTWGSVEGWITPSNSTQTVSADETLTFSGTYAQHGGPDSTGEITDIEGNVYQTIKIGDQWWMAENLRATYYRDGEPIPNVTTGSNWSILSTGAYCEYDNDSANVSTYGRLYNWYAVNDPRGLAPAGWHIPSDDEWKQLELYLGMSEEDVHSTGWRGTDEGGRLKDTTHWSAPNAGATNESGFTALPAGYRNDVSGSYIHMTTFAAYWTSSYSTTSRSWHRDLNSDYSTVQRIDDDQNDGYSIRCVRDHLSVPEVTSIGVTEIAQTTAVCGGSVSSDGGSEVTARGVCWSTNPIPTIADITTVNGVGVGSYVSSVTGLTPNMTYYIRAYATNSMGTGYGAIHSFTTLPTETGTVTDIDGNIYQTIKIGNQWWMLENLKVTHYRNGDPIPLVTGNGTWGDLVSGAYCIYNNDSNNVATYGRLYNWYAVDDGRNIAPEGWHVPTDDEWKQLEMHLGLSPQEADGVYWRGTDEGGKLKEEGTTHWVSPNTGATNESGFTALPSGYRRISGEFSSTGLNAYFWSATQGSSNLAWDRRLYYDHSQVYRSSDYKPYGFSVRCVRD